MNQRNLSLLLLFVFSTCLWAQNNPNPAQVRLMAKRAAQLDAYRQLAEQVKGLRLSSSTTVRDFVTESDQINTAVDTFLKGANVVAVRYIGDGVCEVDMEIDFNQLVGELTNISQSYPSRNQYNFNQMGNYHKAPVVRATGTGAMNGPITAPTNNYELEQLKNQYYQLLADYDQLSNQIAQLQATNEQLQANSTQLASLQSERQSLLNQINQMRQQLEASRLEQQRSASELAQMRNAHNKLGQDFQNLQARLGDLNRLQNENAQMRQQLNALNQERQANASAFAQMQNENAQMRQQLNALSQERQANASMLAQLKNENARLQQENNKLANYSNQMKGELDAARFQANQAAGEVNQLRSQMAQLQNELKGVGPLRQENNTLRQQLFSVQKDLENSNARFSQFQQQTTMLQQENEALKAENMALQQELEDLRSRMTVPTPDADIWNQYPPQYKLMAKRAAQLDAYRQIAENIKGLKIDSNTTVNDFVTESDVINAALNTFINGLRTVSVRYLPDLTCEVTVEVTLQQVIEELKTIKKRYYQGGRYHDQTFNQIQTFTRSKVISATGTGTVK